MKSTPQRLRRSRSDKLVAGVAGGIGHYLAVDPVVVRIVFVVLTLMNGVGLLAYLILWAVTPAEPQPHPRAPESRGPSQQPDARGRGGKWQVFVAGSARRARFDPMTGQPLDPEQEIPIQNLGGESSTHDKQLQRNWILGTVLVAFGVFLILKAMLPGVAPLLVPALLIAAGVFLLGRSSEK